MIMFRGTMSMKLLYHMKGQLHYHYSTVTHHCGTFHQHCYHKWYVYISVWL